MPNNHCDECAPEFDCWTDASRCRKKITFRAESMKDGRNVKCPRCLHYHSVIENFDNLCDRCQSIILTHFPNHPSVEHIKSELEKQRIKYAK